MGTPVTAGFWLSPQQKHVWMLQQEGRALRSACVIQLDLEIAEPKLAAALKQGITRHEILRTIYLHQPGMKFPFQVVLDAAEPLLQKLDLSELPSDRQTEKMEELFRSTQCPSVGPEQAPVFTATFTPLPPNRTAVLLTIPPLS